MTTLMDNLDEYRIAFKRFAHGADKLPLHRLGHLLRYLGLNPTESEVEDLKNEIDEDQNGFIDMNEFVQMVQDQFAGQDNDEELLEILFRQIDTTGRGSMSLDEIRKAIEDCKTLVSDPEEQKKLRKLILNKDTSVNKDEPLDGMEVSKLQRLKKWALGWVDRIKGIKNTITNQLSTNPPNYGNNNNTNHGYNNNNCPDNQMKRDEKSRNGSEASLLKVKPSHLDEEDEDDIWLSKNEIEAMVREFDIEGQGRFDTGAFIKAWKELHEII